jgi:hypothetical protein
MFILYLLCRTQFSAGRKHRRHRWPRELHLEVSHVILGMGLPSVRRKRLRLGSHPPRCRRAG